MYSTVHAWTLRIKVKKCIVSTEQNILMFSYLTVLYYKYLLVTAKFSGNI